MSSRGRSLAAAILAVTALVALGACTRCSCTKIASSECDAELLRQGIEEIRLARSQHPAWFGDPTPDGRLSVPLVRDKLLQACPELPEPLHHRIDTFSRLHDERQEWSLETPPAEFVAEYRKWRHRVCDDPSVYEEMHTLGPEKAGLELLRRCGFDDGPLAEVAVPLLSSTHLFGFVLYQFLLDEGIEQELARDFVSQLAFPWHEREIEVDLPSSSHSLGAPAGIMLRIEDGALDLPNGPSVSVSAPDPKQMQEVTAWVTQQVEATGAEPDPYGPYGPAVVVVIAGDEPAVPLGLIANAFEEPIPEIVVLARHARGFVVAEPLRGARPSRPATHLLRRIDGRVVVREVATDGTAVDAPADDGPEALSRWSSSLDHPEDVAIDIEVGGLTAQELVDVMGAVRGSDCVMSVDDTSGLAERRFGCENLDYRLVL